MTTGLSFKLIETDLELIRTYMQTNLPAALAVVSADRATVLDQMPVPREYLTFETAQAYECPVIFIIPDNQDYRLYEKNSNCINALSRIYVNAVIESRRESEVSYIAYRYQAAMCQILAQTCLLNADNTVQIIIKVTRSKFSAMYTDAQKKGQASGVFRKEVLLELDVEHYEKL